jgi:hypothetical protein
MIGAGEPVLVVIGDSLTEHGAWPDAVGAETGWPVRRAARSGQTSTEVALRVGARNVDLRVVGPDGAAGVVVVPEPVPGDMRVHVHEGMDDIRVHGALGDRPGVLAHRVSASATEGWTFHPDHPDVPDVLDVPDTPDVQEVPGTVRFRPDPLPVPHGAVVVLWCGRNNPGAGVVSDVEAIVRQVERDAAEVLVLGVHAAAFEVSGSAGAAVVDEVNAALAARHGERFVDVQAALLAAVPTGDGVAAAELRVDDVHLSARGDAVVAQAVGARLRAVGRWPVAGA